MARIILTNNESKFNKAIKRNVHAGFDDYVQHKDTNYFIAAHKKRIKKIDNFIKQAGGDFCCVAGTCIYNNTFGKDALDLIYRDFKNDVESIREKIIGNYVIALKKSNHIIIFVDKYQILKVYYFNIGNDWFITNSLADAGSVLDEIEIHEFSFMQETMLIGAIGTQSIFQNVFRLFGHQYIEIDCLNNSFTLKKIPYSRKRRNFDGRTIESAVSEYADLVRSKFAIIANIFGRNIRLHQTGGLDNRTVFSAFMSVGCKPKIMYGVGNSILTNTKNEDLLICKAYQKKFGLDFYEMNWRENYIGGNKYWSTLFDRYGFNLRIYGGSRNFFKEYESKIPNYPEFMECGLFLENLRIREWAYNSGKISFSLDDFVEGYLLGVGFGNFYDNRTFYNRYKTLKEHIIDILKNFITLYKIAENDQISIDSFNELEWIATRYSHSLMVNFLNEFAPSIAMFSLPELHEFPFDVPAIWRANGRFQLMLINSLYPQALNVPIFSHCQKARFEKNTFAIVPDCSRAQLIRAKLKMFGVPEGVLNKIGKLHSLVSTDTKITTALNDETTKLKEYITAIINEYDKDMGNFVDPKTYEGPIVYLMIYAQYLYGSKLLKDEKK